MTGIDTYATTGVASALCVSLSKRLLAPHGLKASTAYRSAQTLGLLVDALIDEGEAEEGLHAALHNLVGVLTLRVSQSIAGADDEEIYHLGRVLSTVRSLESRCRTLNIVSGGGSRHSCGGDARLVNQNG